MNRALFVTLVAVPTVATALLLAQTGSVTSVAPQPPSGAVPGSFKATAGTVTCSAVGNAVPATSVAINCTAGPTTYPTATPVFQSGVVSSYTLNLGYNGDTVTIMVYTKAGSNVIQWQAGATPVSGTAGSGQGNF